MYRQPNPLGLLEIGATAVLAAVGVAGLVMGWRETLLWEMEQQPPGPEPTPKPTREPELPEIGAKLDEMRSWMRARYPNADCYREGEARGWSVTGPGDGFHLKWELYEEQRGADRWIVVYEYKHPTGQGHGADPGLAWLDAIDKLNDLEDHGWKEYRERQKYRGDPFVEKIDWSGYRGC
jgi:hypothetical protein